MIVRGTIEKLEIGSEVGEGWGWKTVNEVNDSKEGVNPIF
jgi:hypothetical protein